MRTPVQSALADEQAFALHERCGAAAYGMDREQFAAILRDIQSKYLPLASPDEAGNFCAALRLEELVLARACAAGNERAWQDFVSRYQNKLRAIALHITRDAAHASELADSLFADLYGLNSRDGVRNSKLTSYTARGSLEGWLRTVMAQEFINRYRKTKRDVSLDEQEEEGTQFVAPDARPEAISDARVAEATDEALGELSAEDRYVLAAYHLDGRTLAEIARLLGLHESSISRRLDRVTTTLRKRILACLRERGMSHAQAREALEGDVRDLNLDLRARLAQDSGIKAFPGGKGPAPGPGGDGNHV
jgi:RNA polymerase sigma-70 factor (ECF subfamily)